MRYPTLFAIVILAATPGASLARATAGEFHDERSFSDTITNWPCAEGTPVLMTGTITSDGHFTELESHLSAHGTDAIDYRVDLPDGNYALGHVIDRFKFAINFNRPRNVDTSTQREQATLYSADGRPMGAMDVSVTYHVTYADVNGNFEPDPDEITTAVDRFRVTCP
jgi:hypothetical protein